MKDVPFNAFLSRWMWLAGKWVQLEAKGNMLFVHNEDGGLVLFDRDDIIDILDAIEAGQIYSHAGGGPYAPLRIDTEPANKQLT